MLDNADLAKQAQALDASDPILSVCDQFERPDGWIFFDPNSIGPTPKSAGAAAANLVHEWATLRRRGWAERDWIHMPAKLGDLIAPMIGAGPGEVLVCDNTTVNLYKAVGHALEINHDRSVLVTPADNFPTDLHVLQGFEQSSDRSLTIRYVETEDEAVAALDETVALGSFSHVEYKSGARWDMDRIGNAARDAGALTLWDVSHSAGAVPVDAHGSGADYIVGCGYKYLSMGPGGPAFIYVRPDLVDQAWPPICGWMGHAETFSLPKTYVPHEGIIRFLAGTPMVGANSLAHCAAEIFNRYGPDDLWSRHQSLSEFFILAVETLCGPLGAEVTSPRDYQRRGGHVSLKAPGAGRVVQALIDAKVVSSFRKPDSIRFGISPLALTHVDIYDSVSRLRDILEKQTWKDPKYANVSV